MTTPTIQLVRRRRRRRARATVSPCPLEIRSNNVSASGSSPSFMNSSRLPRPWRRSNGSLIARRPPCRTPLAAVAALETDVRPPCQRTHRALRRGPGRSVRSTSTTTGLHDLIPTATPTRRPAPHESRSERPTGGDHATNETASTRSRLCADHVAGRSCTVQRRVASDSDQPTSCRLRGYVLEASPGRFEDVRHHLGTVDPWEVSTDVVLDCLVVGSIHGLERRRTRRLHGVRYHCEHHPHRVRCAPPITRASGNLGDHVLVLERSVSDLAAQRRRIAGWGSGVHFGRVISSTIRS